jgi:hypothetical protein
VHTRNAKTNHACRWEGLLQEGQVAQVVCTRLNQTAVHEAALAPKYNVESISRAYSSVDSWSCPQQSRRSCRTQMRAEGQDGMPAGPKREAQGTEQRS